MASAEEIKNSFLSAEAQAAELATQLQRLAGESSLLRDGHAAVNGAATQLGKTAERLSDLAEGCAEVVGQIAAIGTPELLREAKNTNAKLDQLTQAMLAADEARMADRKQLESLRTLVLGVGALALLSLIASAALVFVKQT